MLPILGIFGISRHLQYLQHQLHSGFSIHCQSVGRLTCSLKRAPSRQPQRGFRDELLDREENRMRGDPTLEQRYSLPMLRTNIENVYTAPPLPEDLDLKNASDEMLRHHGIYFPRPKPGDPPEIAAIWESIYRDGLNIANPQLEVRRPSRRPGPPGGNGGSGMSGPQSTSSNLCGAVLEGSGNWNSVCGILQIPYLRLPPNPQDNPLASLSGWVGLDGYDPSSGRLLQSCIGFSWDAVTSSTSISQGYSQWWIPTPGVIPVGSSESQYHPGFITVPNDRATSVFSPGNYLCFYCGYPSTPSGLAVVSFLFATSPLTWSDPNKIRKGGPSQNLFKYYIPPPANVPIVGTSVEWIIENEAKTNGPADAIMPIFSGSPNSITPVRSINAYGTTTSGQKVSASEGFTVLWSDSNGDPSPVSEVTLSQNQVSILYTGPS